MIGIGWINWRIRSICKLVLVSHIRYQQELVQLGSLGIDNIAVESIEPYRFCYMLGWKFGIGLGWKQVGQLGSFGIG